MSLTWTLITAILALGAGIAGYLLGARRTVRARAIAPSVAPVAFTPPASTDSEIEDEALTRARELARAHYEIALHLGFEAMPDPLRPALRRVRVPADDREALARLESGAIPCVSAVAISRDGRRATLLIDVSLAPPS